MKEKNIELKPTKTFSPYSQCFGKKKYELKRRAIKKAREYTAETGMVFTVYECPHCGAFHIGKVI